MEQLPTDSYMLLRKQNNFISINLKSLVSNLIQLTMKLKTFFILETGQNNKY